MAWLIRIFFILAAPIAAPLVARDTLRYRADLCCDHPDRRRGRAWRGVVGLSPTKTWAIIDVASDF
jgi:hypothetical protein